MNFKEARVNAGKTVLEVARAFNVAPQAIYQWESGETLPAPDKWCKLAKMYGVTVEELLVDTDSA